jgi:hypothetical protein
MTIIHDKTKYGLGWFPTEVRRGLRWRGSPVIFFSGGPAPLWGGTHQLGDSAQYSRESRWDGALLSVGRRPQSRHGAKSSRGLKPPPLMGLMQCCSRRRSPKFSFFFFGATVGSTGFPVFVQLDWHFTSEASLRFFLCSLSFLKSHAMESKSRANPFDW